MKVLFWSMKVLCGNFAPSNLKQLNNNEKIFITFSCLSCPDVGIPR